MTNIIFVGGFENTGTRLIVEFLNFLKYSNLNCNDSLDYLGIEFLKLFDIYWETKNTAPLFNKIKRDNKDKKNIIIKHGHLCMINKELKKEFINSKFILCLRDPLDMIVKDSHNYQRYAKLDNPTVKQKFDHLKIWYSDDVVKNSDMIVKLEDMVFNSYNTFKNIAKYLEIEHTDSQIKQFIKIIKPSQTIGNGKILYNQEDNKLITEILKYFKHINSSQSLSQ